MKRLLLSFFSELAVIRQYSGSMSIPMLFLPYLTAAIIVVPAPLNGSKTVSFVKENILTNRDANSSGNGAGWVLVDAPGIFHIIFDNCIWLIGFS